MEDEPCPDLDPVLFRDRPGRENINVQITIFRKIRSILCTSWYALIMELSFKGNIRQDRSAVSNFWHYPHFKGHVIRRKYFTPVPF